MHVSRVILAAALLGCATASARSTADDTSFFAPSEGDADMPPRPLGSLMHWDPQVGAYAITESSYAQRWKRAPDGRRALVALTFGAERVDGEPRGRRLRRDLPYVTYEQSRGPGVGGVALIVVDLESHAMTPLVLPFELERADMEWAWLDDEHVLVVGDVVGGVLRNWRLRNGLYEPFTFTVVGVVDASVRRIVIPRPVDTGLPEADDWLSGCVPNFASHVDVGEGGLFTVSCSLPQVIGGGWGEACFTAAGQFVRFARGPKRIDVTGGCNAADRIPSRLHGEFLQPWQVPDGEPCAATYWFMSPGPPCPR